MPPSSDRHDSSDSRERSVSTLRRRWRTMGVHRRVRVVFLLGGVLLALFVGLTIWLLARGYLTDVRQGAAVRQAQASAVTVQRLLTPQDPGLPRQAEELSGVNESGVLVLRGQQTLASAGLTLPQVPQVFRQRVEAGERLRQRVRIDGEVRLLVGIPLSTGASYYQSLPFRELDRTLSTLSLALLGAGVTVALSSLLLAGLAVRGALRPVEDLTRAAQAVARGDLGTRLPEDDRDLADLARVFNATTADLERRVRESTRFAGTVSHELRTPLTTMANAVVLLERRREQLPEVAREAVQLLSSQLARFQRLLLDLLDIAVVTDSSDRLALEPVDLSRQVAQLAQAEGWGPVEATGEPVVVHADPRRLDRIVSNLVNNANTHGAGLVRVGVLRCGDAGRIEVDDAGPGIPVADREAVFERFTRGTSAGVAASSGGGDGAAAPPDVAASPGVGLGLAFVAELAALQHGRVWVQDAPAGGSRFVVELPVSR